MDEVLGNKHISEYVSLDHVAYIYVACRLKMKIITKNPVGACSVIFISCGSEKIDID